MEQNTDILTMPVAHDNAFAVPNVPYRYLSSITCGFGSEDSGRKVGSGGFADVYLGVTHRSRHRLAVKRLKEATVDPERVNQLFNYEVGELSRLRNR